MTPSITRWSSMRRWRQHEPVLHLPAIANAGRVSAPTVADGIGLTATPRGWGRAALRPVGTPGARYMAGGVPE